MNKNAINKLRKKFILSSMMALIATMLVMLSLLFLSYTVISRQSIRLTLDYIINHGGEVNNISFSSITVKEEVTDYAGKESESYES